MGQSALVLQASHVRGSSLSLVASFATSASARRASAAAATATSSSSSFRLAPAGPSTRTQHRTLANMPGLRSLPHDLGTVDIQKSRILQRLREKATDLDRYEYPVGLQHANSDLFYRTLIDNVPELMPLVYTPTIGTACLQYSRVFSYVSNALFLSYKHKGKIYEALQKLPNDMSICVVTDGSRILGLGDQGVDGVGIPMGKLSLYTACAGINPAQTLPVVLDVGTNNAEKLRDPLYIGLRQNRITAEEEKEFVVEFMQATQKRWPGMVVQFEDFSTEL